MTDTKRHPTEIELADFLSGALKARDKERIEDHIACCDECLDKTVSAYEAVELFNEGGQRKKGKIKFMKRFNIYLILAVIAFLMSFVTPRYFIQSLVATLILGIKWVIDSKETKMLIMIYEAWKKGGEREASRILQNFDSGLKPRL